MHSQSFRANDKLIFCFIVISTNSPITFRLRGKEKYVILARVIANLRSILSMVEIHIALHGCTETFQRQNHWYNILFICVTKNNAHSLEALQFHLLCCKRLATKLYHVLLTVAFCVGVFQQDI